MPQGINDERVSAWLSAHVPALETPVQFELIAGGHSNLTYRCRDNAGRAYVLRRPPLGQVLQSAHDVARECRIVEALSSSAVPVAPSHGLCEDLAVNDAPFFVMDFVAGEVLHNREVAERVPMPERQQLAYHVIDVLAALHQIEPASVGLQDLGRHDAYLARQLKRWARQWQAVITHPVPAITDAERLLGERMPQQVGSVIVHGDYRLGNFIVAGGRIQAVLDWELCTLGDALADLGYLLNSWVSKGEGISGVDDALPTLAGGFPHRDVLANRYADLTGRDVTQINYYRAFSYWRIAAIRQGVYKRYIDGAMGDPADVDVELIRASVERCAEAALSLLNE